MNQSIVSRGKNIQEAVSLGLDLLEAKKEEVNIEILQQESKGFLKLRSKPAIVRLTKHFMGTKAEKAMESDFLDVPVKEQVKENQVPLQENEQLNNSTVQVDLDGKVWVEQRQIFCEQAQHRYPMITVGPGVMLIRNNEVVTGTIVVTPNDLLEIATEEEMKETIWNIELQYSKLYAVLYVEPGYRKTYVVRDCSPADHIELSGEEQVKVWNSLQYEQIMDRLHVLGVTQGIQYGEIMKAIEAVEPGNFIIAKGVEPEEGKSGWLDIKVDLENEEHVEHTLLGSEQRKRTDFVQKGEVMAVVHYPVLGKAGLTVTNEPIMVQPTSSLIMKVGPGTTMIGNGTTIVATEAGRPYIKTRGMFASVSILPKYIHEGNVNPTSGDIQFLGDVEILGSVEDGMKVEAEGDIFIGETISMAKVTSNNAIKAGTNIIASTVSAGKNNMLVTELEPLLKDISELTEKIIRSIEQLEKVPAFKTRDLARGGFRPLMRILLEQKFKELHSLIHQYEKVVKKGDSFLEKEWEETGEQLRLCFLSTTSSEYNDKKAILYLLRKLQVLQGISKAEVEPNAFISAAYAVNSTLYSSGDVILFGKGCYNSKIYAGGVLQINGILRGGTAYARLGAQLNEVGSGDHIRTLISVPGDQRIFMKTAREGTVIQIGKVKHRFLQTERLIEAFLDDQGKIVFDYLR